MPHPRARPASKRAAARSLASWPTLVVLLVAWLLPRPASGQPIVPGVADERVTDGATGDGQQYPLWTPPVWMEGASSAYDIQNPMLPGGTAYVLVLAVDAAGTVHAAWLGVANGTTNVYYANNRFETRGPYGNGFSPRFAVSNAAPFPAAVDHAGVGAPGYFGVTASGVDPYLTFDMLSMAVGPDGAVHVVWIEQHSDLNNGAFEDWTNVLYRVRQPDGTWQAASTILTGSASSTFDAGGARTSYVGTLYTNPTVTVDGAGVVYVACRRLVVDDPALPVNATTDVLYGPGLAFQPVGSASVATQFVGGGGMLDSHLWGPFRIVPTGGSSDFSWTTWKYAGPQCLDQLYAGGAISDPTSGDCNGVADDTVVLEVASDGGRHLAWTSGASGQLVYAPPNGPVETPPFGAAGLLAVLPTALRVDSRLQPMVFAELDNQQNIISAKAQKADGSQIWGYQISDDLYPGLVDGTMDGRDVMHATDRAAGYSRTYEPNLGAQDASVMFPAGPGMSVNVANGNLFGAFPLFATSGVGLPTAVTLYFNSKETQPFTMGQGWSHSFDIVLDRSDPMLGYEPSLRLADGRRIALDGSSTDTMFDFLARLVEDQPAPGMATVITKLGLRYVFLASGKLDSIHDTNGNELACVYDGNGRLATVTDSTGRVTTFAYDPAGLLATVTDPGQTQYALDYAGTQLVRVHLDAAGLDLPWEFDYHPASDVTTFAKKGMISEVRTPRGVAAAPTYGVDYTYYPDWRVRSAEDPAAPMITSDTDPNAPVVTSRPQRMFTYDDSRPPFTTPPRALVQDRRQNAWIVEYQYDTSVATKVTDPAGSSVVRTFGDYRTVTSVTDKRGAMTQLVYDPGYPANLRQVIRPKADNSGFLAPIQYEYSSDASPGGNDDLNRVTAVTDTLGARTASTYDTAGNLLQVQHPATTLVTGAMEHAAETYTRDAMGRILTYTDAEKGVTTYVYGDATTGLPTEVCLDGEAPGMGLCEQSSYDVMGNRSSVTARPNDKPGGLTTFTRDTLHRLTIVTDPLLDTTTTTYDANSNVVDVQSPRLFHTTRQYDARDLLTVEAPPAPAGPTSFVYDQEAEPRRVTDGNGFQTRTLYDTLGRASKGVSDTGSTVGLPGFATIETDYQYDPNGNLASETQLGPPQRTTTCMYDARNNRTQVQTGTDPTTLFVDDLFYDDDDRLISSQRSDPTGFQAGSLRILDERGRARQLYELSAAYVPGAGTLSGSPTSVLFDGNSHAVQVWSPDGSPSKGPASSATYVYDPRQRLVSTMNGLGQIMQQIDYYEDGSQKALEIPDPQGGSGLQTVETLAYTVRKELEQSTDALGNATVTGYDADGNTTLVTEPLGTVTQLEYDAAGRMITDTLCPGTLAIAHTHGYDGVGNETSVTAFNPATGKNDAVYTKSYTAGGSLEKVTYPGSTQSETWTYDAYGEAASHTDPAGKTSTTQYDEIGRPTTITYGAPFGVTVTLNYDGASDVTQIDDGSTTQTTTYDALKRPKSVAWSVGAKPFKSVGYGYDAAGHRTSMTDPEGVAHAYTYDADERPDTLSRAGAMQAQWGYDAGGRPATTALANGALVSRGYGPREELASVRAMGSSGVLAGFAYTYDARGSRVGVAREHLGENVTYAIDCGGRLTGETSTGGDISVNACVNTVVTEPAATVTSAFTNVATINVKPGGPGVVPKRALVWQYDQAGNRIEQTSNGQTTTYTYDAQSRLVSEATTGGAVTHAYDDSGNETTRTTMNQGATTVETFGYDYANRLASYVKAVGGATTASFTYTFTPSGQRLSKQDVLAGTTEWYMYDGDDVVTDYTQSGAGPMKLSASYVQALGIDSKILRIDADGTSHYYVGDALGSVGQVLGGKEGVERTEVTDAWGNVVASSGTDDRYGFTQREHDDESGLMHFRAREYDPKLGRFLQKDPLGNLDAYGYASGDPVSRTDPMGLDDDVPNPFGIVFPEGDRAQGARPGSAYFNDRWFGVSFGFHQLSSALEAQAAGAGPGLREAFLAQASAYRRLSDAVWDWAGAEDREALRAWTRSLLPGVGDDSYKHTLAFKRMLALREYNRQCAELDRGWGAIQDMASAWGSAGTTNRCGPQPEMAYGAPLEPVARYAPETPGVMGAGLPVGAEPALARAEPEGGSPSIEEVGRSMAESLRGSSWKGPCLSIVEDSRTGETFFCQNVHGSPIIRSQVMGDGIAAVRESLAFDQNYQGQGASRLGSHSEIQALDEALARREALGLPADKAALGEMRLYNVSLEGRRFGQWMPRCGARGLNCVAAAGDDVVIVLPTAR